MSKITTLLYGRLGNQMFQIANCIAHATRHGFPYEIPMETHPNQWPVYFKHFKKLSTPVYDFSRYQEKQYEFVQIPRLELLCFDGHWRSYKYFWDYKEIVLASFAPGFDFPELDNISFSGWVSVHVRRGDYINLSHLLPPVSAAYIKQAITYFVENYGYIGFNIFSDDIEWCKLNLRKELLVPEYSQVHFNYMDTSAKDEVKDALFDMYAMSRHDHNIISNSTFGYWAGIMNKNPDKIVVYPNKKNWFDGEYSSWDLKDMFPDDWVEMPFIPKNSVIDYKLPETGSFWCHMQALGASCCQTPCGVGKCDF